MSPEEQAAGRRLRASYLELMAARERVHDATVKASASLQRYLDDEHISAHPDLVELDVRLDATYDL